MSFEATSEVLPHAALEAHPPAGSLRGTTEGAGIVWRGIPYAQAPVADLRFRAPRPLEPWSGVRGATAHAALPPQRRSGLGMTGNVSTVHDEDCLTLTVWSLDTSGKRPVMVWIPGGGFFSGAGQLEYYSGKHLSANGDVVVVNLTYRLGVFGGLELGSLGEGFDSNLALRDQIAALQWVRENIAAFGGDPDDVTVFGGSAGATSVLALLASPAASGLFHRAIAQSPGLPLIASSTRRRRHAEQFLEIVGCSPAELKTRSARELRRAAGALQIRCGTDTPGLLAYGLTYDDAMLPQSPLAAALSGATAGIPLILGTTRDEATLFARDRPALLPTTAECADRLFARTDPAARATVLAAYPSYPSPTALRKFATDSFFTAPAIAFAAAHSAHTDTFVYRFDYAALGPRLAQLGATHGSEIVHILHTYDTRLGRMVSAPVGDRGLGRRMQAAWLGFASSSDPGWPRYEAGKRTTQIFGGGVLGRTDSLREDPDSPRRLVWENVRGYE